MRNTFVHICDTGGPYGGCRDGLPEDLSEWACHDPLMCLALNITIVAGLCRAFDDGGYERGKWQSYMDACQDGFGSAYGEIEGWRFWRPGCGWSCL